MKRHISMSARVQVMACCLTHLIWTSNNVSHMGFLGIQQISISQQALTIPCHNFDNYAIKIIQYRSMRTLKHGKYWNNSTNHLQCECHSMIYIEGISILVHFQMFKYEYVYWLWTGCHRHSFVKLMIIYRAIVLSLASIRDGIAVISGSQQKYNSRLGMVNHTYSLNICGSIYTPANSTTCLQYASNRFI